MKLYSISVPEKGERDRVLSKSEKWMRDKEVITGMWRFNTPLKNPETYQILEQKFSNFTDHVAQQNTIVYMTNENVKLDLTDIHKLRS